MLKAVILIGGQSKRMGEEKHLIEHNGKPHYEFIADLLKGLGLSVYISCNEQQAKSLPDSFNKIVDEYDSIGPISGVISAMKSDPQMSWLVLACDLTNLNEEVLKDLISASDDTFDVVTYQKPGAKYFETTISIYNPGAYIILKREVRSKRYSLQNTLRKCTVKVLDIDNEDDLKNANTPADLS